jgi:hypothetical protein
MYKTFTERLSITKLGKRDEIVKEKGLNNKDGWGWSVQVGSVRVPAPTRKKCK